MNTPKKGDLKVWWIPQVPMKSFYYPVSSPQEGFILLDALAKYDIFQYENNVKPDFCNAGGLMEFDPEMIEEGDEDFDGWSEWYSPMGEDMDYYLREDDGLELLNKDINFQFEK